MKQTLRNTTKGPCTIEDLTRSRFWTVRSMLAVTILLTSRERPKSAPAQSSKRKIF